MIDLTKLLPPNVRRTQEWVDIIATYQQFLQSEIVPQMNSFLDRYEYDKISDEDALKTIWGFGFNISQGAGYTETHRYIQRQLRTMIKRIKSKGTEVSYQYLFYVYDLIGEVYPTIYTPFGFLRTYQNWLTSDELDLPPLKLDTGLTLDQPYGTDPEWFLDYGAISALITRHFIIAYGPQHIENDVPEFMSEFTAQAFHNDVMQTRRKIEIPHYEFFFTASAPLAGTVQLENWTDLDNTVSYDQQSIRVSNVLDFSNAAKVQFGSGVQSPVDNTITGVQTLIQQYDLATTFEVSTQSANALVFKHKVFPTLTFFDFREIAILDSSNNCIFYSVAPWVRYPPNTKCHVKVALTLT